MVSEEKKQDELIEANFNLFKIMLRNFIEDNFTPCSGFINDFNASTRTNIKKLFIRYSDEVYRELGGDTNLEDEIDELNKELEDLNCEIATLEDELDEIKFKFGTTLDDEFKQEYINQYCNDYTSSELEDLLINGKKYLKK